jgi:FKBP-type peptidyl-prolyl cis-trans isomerase
MATQKAQRIGIWIIAIVLTVGTLASFVAIILAPKNEASDQAKLASLSAQYQTAQDEYQKKVDIQAAQLSKKYFDEFNKYTSRVSAFDKASATKLSKEDLKVGDGAVIDANSTFSAYYHGWGPEGKVYSGSSSIESGKLSAPLSVSPGSVIEGWTEGVVGMKVGGIRELTIPSDKAYKDTGKGDIAPNTPLKFIIMIIPTPETIPQPEVPPELLKYYTNGGHF